MRILHLAHQYLPEFVGGVELYTQSIVQGLARRGHETSVYYRSRRHGNGLEHTTRDGVGVWAGWAGEWSATSRFLATFRDPAIEPGFQQVLDTVQPDLVHVQHLMGLPASLIRAIRQRRIPFVVTLWDYWWICANAQLLTNYGLQICDGPRFHLNCARCALARAGHSLLYPAMPVLAGMLAQRNRLTRSVAMSADGLIAPTDFVWRWYRNHGFPGDNMRVIQPGLEDIGQAARNTQPPPGPIHFAYIGGLSWQKGIHVLVEAFRGIEGPAELWIAGDESFDPAYVARLKMRATPNVHFLGRLTRPEVWQTLAQAHAVVVPTLWYETFSFIVSEGFAAGLPVLASRLGPLADRVRDGVDGLLLPAGDVPAWRQAIQQLVDDRSYLDCLRAEVQTPPSIDDHLNELEAFYRQVVSPESRRPNGVVL